MALNSNRDDWENRAQPYREGRASNHLSGIVFWAKPGVMFEPEKKNAGQKRRSYESEVTIRRISNWLSKV